MMQLTKQSVKNFSYAGMKAIRVVRGQIGRLNAATGLI